MTSRPGGWPRGKPPPGSSTNDPRSAEFEDEENREAPPVFVCECARDRCVEDLEMTLAEWESVRERPGCFVIAPGHEIPAIEDVIKRRPSYVVVKKRV